MGTIILELYPQIESLPSSQRAMEILEANGFHGMANDRDTYCLANQRVAAAAQAR